MQLADYLKSRCLSDRDFAASIGVKRQTVHKYRRGERRPDCMRIAKIAEVTKGKVTARDFLDGR
jgi:transcriptional regulator with XRE-family HTH domain